MRERAAEINRNAVQCNTTSTNPGLDRHNDNHNHSSSHPAEGIVRLDIDETTSMDIIDRWWSQRGAFIGPDPPLEAHTDIKRTFYTYAADLDPDSLIGEPTPLLQSRVQIKPGTQPHKAKARGMAQLKLWWLQKYALKGIQERLFESTITANGQLSAWSSVPVLIKKEGSSDLRLTFDYSKVDELVPGITMQKTQEVHNFLKLPSHRVFSKFDLHNAYWTVEIHPDDRHFFAFDVPGVGQLQPTRMPQGARTSSFTLNQLCNMAFGQIDKPRLEPSFLHNKAGPFEPPDMSFYMDDIFPAHDGWEKHWHFIKYHLLPRMRWAKMRLSLHKVQIGMHKMLALGQMHEVGGVQSPKESLVDKIVQWQRPKTVKDVLSFTGTVQVIRQLVPNFAEMARPLTRITSSSVFQWGDAEELAFRILKKQASNVFDMYGHDPRYPVELYTDASQFAAGCFVRQMQGDDWIPLAFDSYTFSKKERKYSTPRRELLAMVLFAEKFRHMLQASEKSSIFTDHKPNVGFLDGPNEDGHLYRWQQRLRCYNIQIRYIKGKANEVADIMSRNIFGANCESTEAIRALLEDVLEHDDDVDWFDQRNRGGLVAAMNHRLGPRVRPPPDINQEDTDSSDDESDSDDLSSVDSSSSDDDSNPDGGSAGKRPLYDPTADYSSDDDFESVAESPDYSDEDYLGSGYAGSDEAADYDQVVRVNMADTGSSKKRKAVQLDEPGGDSLRRSARLGTQSGPAPRYNYGVDYSDEDGMGNVGSDRDTKISSRRKRTTGNQIDRKGTDRSPDPSVLGLGSEQEFDDVDDPDAESEHDKRPRKKRGRAKNIMSKNLPQSRNVPLKCKRLNCNRPSKNRDRGLCETCDRKRREWEKKDAAYKRDNPLEEDLPKSDFCSNELCQRTARIDRQIDGKILCAACRKAYKKYWLDQSEDYRHANPEKWKVVGAADRATKCLSSTCQNFFRHHKPEGLCDRCYFAKHGKAATSSIGHFFCGQPSRTQTRNEPHMLHADCFHEGIAMCGHVCCLSRHMTREDAKAAGQKWGPLPSKNLLDIDHSCPPQHFNCDRTKCLHWCCRIRHYKCATEHNECDRFQCVHPCCKVWVQYILERVERERIVNKRMSPLQRVEAQQNLDMIHREIKIYAAADNVDVKGLRSKLGAYMDAIRELSNTKVRADGAIAYRREKQSATLDALDALEAARGDEFEDSASSSEITGLHRDATTRSEFGSSAAPQQPQPSEDDQPGATEPAAQDHTSDQPSDLSAGPDWDLFRIPGQIPAQPKDPDFSVFRSNLIGVDSTNNNVDFEQLHETWYGDIIRYLRDKIEPDGLSPREKSLFEAKVKKYQWEDGGLQYLNGAQWVHCVDPNKVARLLDIVHTKNTHLNARIITEHLKDKYWWPSMFQDTRAFVRSCPQCILWNPIRRNSPIVSLDCLQPWTMLQADLMGPLPESTSGHKYVLVISCVFTGFLVTRPLANKTRVQVQKELFGAFDTFYDPIVLWTDGAHEFGQSSDAVFTDRGIVLLREIPGTHRTTGHIESHISIIRKSLQKLVPTIRRDNGEFGSQMADWPESLCEMTKSLNQRHVKSLGFSPVEVFFGTQPHRFPQMQEEYPDAHVRAVRILAETMSTTPLDTADMGVAAWNNVCKRTDAKALVAKNKTHSRTLREQRSQRTLPNTQFEPGDLVVARVTDIGYSVKYRLSQWRGPFILGQRLGEHGKTFMLKDPYTKRDLDISRHIEQLRRYIPRPDRLQTAEGLKQYRELLGTADVYREAVADLDRVRPVIPEGIYD